MIASKLFPKMYRGKEDSGGYLARNDRPAGKDSPSHRGRLYIEGVGWFWLAGWPRQGKRGGLLALSIRGMTDQEATQYCAPRPERRGRQSSQEQEHYPPGSRLDDTATDSDIPF